MSFFDAVDQVLATDYLKKFANVHMTVDALLPRMAQIARLHCLGVLVIDEIQHLNLAKSGGSDKMLNFFVTLVNIIGVPVVLIGTTKAMSILQGEFRQARRGSGQGDLFWDRMQNDASWEILLLAMWKNQWTQKRTPYTPALKDAIYDESQGIIDIAVKLYAMAQIKAITDGTETVTPATIRNVAAEKLRLVKPMLDALRSGDLKKIGQFEDIRPIDIEDYISVQARHILIGKPETVHGTVLSLEEQAVLKLLELDIPPKTARAAVSKVLAKSKSGQPLAAVVRKAFKLALNIADDQPEATGDEPQEDDMRKLGSANPYARLKATGIVADDAEKF